MRIQYAAPFLAGWNEDCELLDGATYGFRRRKRRVDCPLYCIQCESGVCIKCELGKYLLNEICVDYDECGLGKFSSDVTGSCEKCKNNCKICDSSVDCLECKVGYFEYAGRCLETCPNKTYIGRGTNKCKACFFTCESCTSFSSNSCTKCYKGYYLYDKRCRKSCPRLKDIAQNEELRSCVNITTFDSNGQGIPTQIGILSNDNRTFLLVCFYVLIFLIGFFIGYICYARCRRKKSQSYQAIPLNDLPQPTYD